MTYQDSWVKGKMVRKGYRECAGRYDLVKAFCVEKFADRPQFSVCDVGANMCYFGIRLAEDFDCSVMAFEFDHFEQRVALLRQNEAMDQILLINRKLSLDDLCVLADIKRFDLVLALSVLHHVKGASAEWLARLRDLGHHLIVEFAGADSVRATKRGTGAVPADATVLGDAESHLVAGMRRPLVAFSAVAQ